MGFPISKFNSKFISKFNSKFKSVGRAIFFLEDPEVNPFPHL